MNRFRANLSYTPLLLIELRVNLEINLFVSLPHQSILQVMTYWLIKCFQFTTAITFVFTSLYSFNSSNHNFNSRTFILLYSFKMRPPWWLVLIFIYVYSCIPVINQTLDTLKFNYYGVFWCWCSFTNTSNMLIHQWLR